jgi:hypothetical protein
MWWLLLCILYDHIALNPYSLCTQLLNMTNLLSHYVNACGFGYLCDSDDKIDRYHMFVTRRFPNCPPCECDTLCFIAGNCCPDRYFQFYQTLRSIFVTAVPEKHDVKMEFVDTCPTGTSAKERNKCEKERGSLERLFSPPYMSKNRSKIYWNKHCAVCNGETDDSLEYWQLFINSVCRKRMFYLSSWEEVIDFANSPRCFLGHSPHDMIPTLPSDNSLNCTNYKDSDIIKACNSSYALAYRSYRNIFCAMCNPFIEIDESVAIVHSTCPFNVRHRSDPHNEWKTLYRLCEHSGRSSLTYPYKNVFCYLCNIRSSTYTGMYGNMLHFANGKIKVQEKSVRWNEFKILVTGIRFKSLDWAFQHIHKKAKLLFNDVHVANPAQLSLNISHLARLFYASANARFCNQSILPDMLPNSTDCTCNPSCIFGNVGKCCFETLMTTPLTCIWENEGDNGYLIINGCYNEELKSKDPIQFSAMKHLCKNELEFPIEVNRISYRNIFCFLCNEERPNSRDIRPWSFMLRCPTEIPLAYYNDLMSSVVTEPRRRRCIVDFDTSMAYRCLSPGPLCTNVEDERIVQACEQTGFRFLRPKMEFCEMCRHPPLPLALKSGCTPTSPRYDQDLYRLCEKLPSVNIYRFGVYKNRFCLECNVLSYRQRSEVIDAIQKKGSAQYFPIQIKAQMQLVSSKLPTPVKVRCLTKHLKSTVFVKVNQP